MQTRYVTALSVISKPRSMIPNASRSCSSLMMSGDQRSWLGYADPGLLSDLQLVLRVTPLVAALSPMTGVSFILFTFYMVTDPATSPIALRGQLWFGAGVAAAYGFLVVCHVVFGLFFALTIVCTLRGVLLYLDAYEARRASALTPVSPPAVVTEA